MKVPSLTFSFSVPFRRWIRVGRSVRRPASTCRPPQNPCSAVEVGVSPLDSARDLSRTSTTEAALAWHSPVDAAYRYRVCALLHESKRPSTTCCSLQPPSTRRSCAYRQRADRLFLIIITQAIQHWELDHRCDGKGICRFRHDADHGHQSTV